MIALVNTTTSDDLPSLAHRNTISSLSVTYSQISSADLWMKRITDLLARKSAKEQTMVGALPNCLLRSANRNENGASFRSGLEHSPSESPNHHK